MITLRQMSDNFIVSARKYRPQTFDEMLGQEAICLTLKSAIKQGKIAHAYLFCGPRGVGKTSAARILARTINCEQLTPEGEACGVCPNCQAALHQRAFNIYELDAASNNSVDDIRRLNEDVYIRPQQGKYKVYIIDEVHMLSSGAFNAFLKTLEEPPGYVVFILATTEKDKVLPTILSRCQVYDFKPIPPEQIAEQLRRVADAEGLQYDPRSFDTIARIADGGMRDALSLFDRLASTAQDGVISYEQTLQTLNILDDEYYFYFTTYLYSGDYKRTLLLLDELLGKGVAMRQLIIGLADFMRNLLVARTPETTQLFPYTGVHAERFTTLAQQIHPLFLYKSISKLVACERNYRSSQAKRLLVELTLMGISEMCGAFKNATVAPATTVAAPSQPAAPAATAPATTAPQESSVQTPQATYQTTPTPSEKKKSPQLATSQPKQYTPRGSSLRISALKRQAEETLTAQQASATQADDDSDASKSAQRDEPVTPDELLKWWLTFADEELTDDAYLSQLLHTVTPELQPPHGLKVSLVSNIQLESFERVERALLRYLKAKLHNDHLTLAKEVAAVEQTQHASTAQERAAYYVENYKEVAYLTKTLDLRIK
ncbi:DNA polymerase III subunit gamma/tau [uncultured Porphyromonas sp.]|uniref:DNA polymerase III subunit gamma/tau n=1 Tax=uncultured Porphyromonas sp. TaxID=159274 RepID=UPI002622468F|nr:DNA polymerase III subunit gamma/tau [uncultured Porphyromonas sp.]